MAKHDITIRHYGQHNSPYTCVCVYIHLCVILVFIYLILTHHFIVFLWFPSPAPFHALLFILQSPFLFICFVSLCSSTTLTIGPTRTLPWFTLLSCLCVWCVLGLFINPDDKGSRSSEVLVNYRTMWHHIPEDSKLHSQWWTQLRTESTVRRILCIDILHGLVSTSTEGRVQVILTNKTTLPRQMRSCLV